MYKEIELTAPAQLCDGRGRLNPAAVGWSRRPLHTCNLRGNWPRKKKWNYWCITTDTHLFSATVSNIDYMGLAFVYFLDFASGQFVEQTVMRPLGLGCGLPDQVCGSVQFRHRQLRVMLDDAPGRTRIRVESPAFGGAPLSADLMVERPSSIESMNVVIPWSERRFQFTSKQHGLPAAGIIEVGGRRLTVAEGTAFACLDYGRGIWPYRGFWNWAGGSGLQGGRCLGLNLGGGWTDGTGLTENALYVDGRVTKLGEDLEFAYRPGDFMRPWRIRTRDSERVDLEFTPFYERVAKTDMLVLRSEVHQLIGRFAGTVVTAAGESIAVENLVGWAEEHRARW